MRAIAVLSVGSLILVGLTQVASAEVIQIQLGGVDLRYNGTNIVDTGTSSPDPLTNATILIDGVPVVVDEIGVTMDLRIPGVLNIPVGGGVVNSNAEGDLDLVFGDGDFLSLTLDSSIVTYIPLSNSVQIVFIGSASSIDDQHLPAGITLGEPVTASFSTQVIEPISQNGGFVSVFVSRGTGEIQGLPEPAAMATLALGGLALILRRRRRAQVR